MRTRILYLLASSIFLLSSAKANERAWGYCQDGNQTVVTSGVSSTTKVQGSFPSCTITVYESDGVTLAVLYSDNLPSPTPKANPFTADSTGFWFFYAANNAYRVQMSGGGIPSPVLLGDILLFDPSSNTSSVIYSADYNFSAISPAGSLIAGSNTVTLVTCPRGVAGTHTIAGGLPHALYIAGTGTPETVYITGGGCTGTGTSGGTIQFTTIGTHSAGYTIQSNTDGVQEAVYVAGATGAVYLPATSIHLRGFVGTTGALTIPGGYTTSLIGSGPLISKFVTHGTTGNWVVFDCLGVCTTGSGGAGGLVTGFSIKDSGNTPHTTGTMLKLRYRSDQIVSNLYINEAYDGIKIEGNARFNHSNFTVGHYHYGYWVTCDGVSYPTCLNYGLVTAPTISTATNNTIGMLVEAPIAGVSIISPIVGSVPVISNSVAIKTNAVGTNPWNEFILGGNCTLDGHNVAFEAIGNGSSYTSNSIQVNDCRLTTDGTVVFASSYVRGLAVANSVLTAAGLGTGIGVLLNGNVINSQVLNNPQINADGAACFQTAGVQADIDFNNNICGRLGAVGVQPASALSLGGTLTNFNVKGNTLSGSTAGAPGVVSSSATITGLNWEGNTGSIGFPFSSFTACAASLQGQTAPISDSTTVTWGATITGGGANKVMGYCNGTNWTVAAK